TTNTYASGRHALAKSGLEDKYVAWNTKAVALAHEARNQAEVDRPLYIAGSVAPYDNWSSYDAATIWASYREQADLLADAKVDLLILEMLGADREHALLAFEAVAHTGLPVWVGLSCLDDPKTGHLHLGAREISTDENEFFESHGLFSTAIQELATKDVSALLMMHSEVHLGTAALQVIRENFTGTIGIYPNAGYWQRPNWAFIETISPEYYWSEAEKWLALEAQIVGGCCGIGPEHIQVVADGVRAV
ncbi:MAG: homocysteine S-methyltransferase family protein, partial [Chloroflexota bacterium]